MRGRALRLLVEALEAYDSLAQFSLPFFTFIALVFGAQRTHIHLDLLQGRH